MDTSRAAGNRSIIFFDYAGQGGQLFGLYLKNIFLSIVTLGIYRFWGQVEITKYIYSNIRLNDKIFGYHATGKEKFLGFLKGLLILGSLMLAIVIISYVFTVVFGPSAGNLVTMVLFTAVGVIVQPLLIYGSHRFLASRSSFANVRFQFVADLKDFSMEYYKVLALTVLTFGIYLPWFINTLNNNLISNTYLGDKKFNYHGNGKDLFFIYLKGMVLSILTFGIYSFWMRASLTQYYFENVDLDGNRMESTITGMDILVLTLFSMFITAVTLGFGLPWAINNAVKVYLDNLTIKVDPAELDQIKNVSDTEASALADGVAEAAETLDAVGNFF